MWLSQFVLRVGVGIKGCSEAGPLSFFNLDFEERLCSVAFMEEVAHILEASRRNGKSGRVTGCFESRMPFEQVGRTAWFVV